MKEIGGRKIPETLPLLKMSRKDPNFTMYTSEQLERASTHIQHRRRVRFALRLRSRCRSVGGHRGSGLDRTPPAPLQGQARTRIIAWGRGTGDGADDGVDHEAHTVAARMIVPKHENASRLFVLSLDHHRG